VTRRGTLDTRGVTYGDLSRSILCKPRGREPSPAHDDDDSVQLNFSYLHSLPIINNKSLAPSSATGVLGNPLWHQHSNSILWLRG